ncbi:dipeptide/heme ABC transporter ATPas [Gammaproteobacteria bacterium]|nr:dipeptide/heme ABC transporter ATPas [Gammaproteobacteria bacterium]
MTDVIMEACGLSKYYKIPRGFLRKDAQIKALDGISFVLHERKTIAVVGESGCGKSTLARQLTLIETPSLGELFIEGNSLTNASAKVIRDGRQKVQMIFQNPFASLNPRKKIGTILAEPLVINTSLNKIKRKEHVLSIMEKVGLRPEFYERYPHMFSGGQRQRIAIARALMLNPKVIIADEPVSALDVSIQAQVLNLLMDLQEELGIAYVFISHDLAVVRHIADEVLVMYLGQAVEQGSKQDIFKKPLHPYTRVLMASAPRLDGNKPEIPMIKGELPSPLNPPTGCAFHSRCPWAQPQCMIERPLLRDIGAQKVACHFAEQYS